MPELPEVETIRRGLVPHVVGKCIAGVVSRHPKVGQGRLEDLVGTTVTAIQRYGKLLVLECGELACAIHLKMTGQLIWWGGDGSLVMGGHPEEGYLQREPHKHTRLVFTFTDSGRLFFNDLRIFGTVRVLPVREVQKLAFVAGLGPEPEQLTAEYLTERLQARKGTVLKSFLLDQTEVAGLGNIYADETCFRAGVLPDRRSGTITPAEAERLVRAAQETIHLALAHQGSSERDYRTAIGEKGTYLSVANVYRRTGQPCRTCGTPIQRVVVGGRSTHFCSSCQH